MSTLSWTWRRGFRPRIKSISIDLAGEYGINGVEMLTPSLPGCHLISTNKSEKFETFNPFCFLFCVLACEWIFIKTDSMESRRVNIGSEIYTVCRRVRAVLSQNILQTGAVKGLNKGPTVSADPSRTIGNYSVYVARQQRRSKRDSLP